MKPSHLILPSLGVLALAACAPGEDSKDGRENTPPIGFELAVAQSGSDTEATSTAVIDLSVDELAEKLAAGNVRLVDVRRPDEFAEGHIEGAELIPLDQFDPAALDAQDGREVVLYCRSGRRSGIAAEALVAHSGKPAQHLSGGILAWQEAGREVERP